MVSNLNTIKDEVSKILEQHPKARDDDRLLILLFWKYQGVSLDIPYELIESLVSPESIRRVRQKLQNEEGKYPPTNFEIVKKRRMREQSMKAWALEGKEVLEL